ncbi:MAG TPA: CoA-binding protein [Balneolaceae bacterium]|nr:CoA-binding protein [Balneolaceae bacterium]
MDKLLKKAKGVAIIGCSAVKYRTSYHIASYLKENGLRILPVNPGYDEVLGEKCYDSVKDIPEDIQVDIVDIFRDSQYTAEMVRETIEWANETGRKPVIWTQLDVSSPEAKSLAEEAGFDYVENKCIMVEHSKKLDIKHENPYKG